VVWEYENRILSFDNLPYLFKNWGDPEMKIKWRKLTNGGILPKKEYKTPIYKYFKDK